MYMDKLFTTDTRYNCKHLYTIVKTIIVYTLSNALSPVPS